MMASTIWGQKPSLDDREILVQKEFSTEIYQVNPIFDYASIMAPKRSIHDFSRDTLTTISAFTPDMDVSIKPIAYKTNPYSTGHKGFVKLDKGTINPLHAQGGYVYSAPNYFNITGRGTYDNRNDNAETNKTIKTIDAGLDMEYYLTKEVKTEIGIQYNRNRYGLYGSQNIVSSLEGQQETGFNTVSAQLGIQTFKTTPDKWNFRFHTAVIQWKDSHTETSETNITALGSIEYTVNDVWNITLTPQYTTSQSEEFGNGNILKGSLGVAYNIKSFYALAGVNADYLSETLRYWPEVDLRWQVGHDTDIKVRSTSQASIWGGSSLTRLNPYVSVPQLMNDVRDYTYARKLSMSVLSSLPRDFDVAFEIGYNRTEGDANFTLAASDIRLFSFDKVDYDLMTIATQVNKRFLNDQVNVGLKVQYNNFAEMSSQLFHRPTVILQPMATAHFINNRLSITASGVINNPQTFNQFPALNTESGWRKNISLAVGFKVIDHLSINLNSDNILDDSYQVWDGYDNFGRNLSGGLLFKF